jgi:hypothetical protein
MSGSHAYRLGLDKISCMKKIKFVIIAQVYSRTFHKQPHKYTWNFTFMWPCIVTNFFVIKPNRCTNFTNLFCHETIHVSDSSSVHHQEFIYCTLRNGIPILVLLESCLQNCMTYTIAECAVNKLLIMDKLSETCRVSWQNKFVKLAHLVGFITMKNSWNFYSS